MKPHVSPYLAAAFTLSLGWVALQAGAQEISKELDKRNRTESGSQYTVVLAARPKTTASPGHVWVVLGVDDEATQTCSAQAWGFYPENDLQTVKALSFEPVKGKLKEEAAKRTSKATAHLFVMVNSENYRKALDIKRAWDGQDTYQLERSDCITYLQAVAKALGLTVPDRESREFPEPYLLRLIKMN